MNKDDLMNFEYFAKLWDDNRMQDADGASKHWNNRAESWGSLLESDSVFKRSLTERVTETAKFLRGHGLLTGDDCVIDIGCGTGRFAVEFAKTARRVTCTDISENMLKLAQGHAEECSAGNIEYTICDFTKANIDALGWTGAFDLVFTSITAAIGDISSLEKAMKISRGYCFNSSFIRNTDELERKIAGEVFNLELKPRPVSEGRSFYALFNLLWLCGYYPKTCYHRQNYDNMVPADDELAEFYEWSIFRDSAKANNAKAQIYEYLQKNSDGGLIRQPVQRWYGWTLWDVRDKDDEKRRGDYDGGTDTRGGTCTRRG